MSKSLKLNSDNASSAQLKLIKVWEEHTRCEFEAKSVDETMNTMTEDPYVFNIPSAKGGFGDQGVRTFYSTAFIPMLPPDTETVLISRTVGNTQIVDELIFKFTHTIKMDWMLPGIEPTNKRVEIPLVAIVGFDDDKISHEHIYWDQASVLMQIGLLKNENLPITGIESAKKIEQVTRAV